MLFFNNKELNSTNTELKQHISALETLHSNYVTDLYQAKESLESLRTELSAINTQTTQLNKKVQSLPKSNGNNQVEIEQTVNNLSQEIFENIK